jgi:hypothetical protein
MMDTAARSLSFPSIAVTLLSYFSLEPDQYPQPLTKARLLNRWLQTYPQEWVRCALVESLYQGRYKTYCVEQILALWHRRGQPIYHFNHEFETMICNNVPQRKETVLAIDAPVVDRFGAQALQPDCDEGLQSSVVPPLSEEKTDASEVSTGLPDEGNSFAPKSTDLESGDRRWTNAFDWHVADVQQSVLASVLNRNQLLPLLLDRIGLVPIHRFMPEAEPVEFCERLAAIASSVRAVTHQESAKAQR